MKRFLVLLICSSAVLSAQADIVYLKQGDVYAGTITHMDDTIIRLNSQMVS